MALNQKFQDTFLSSLYDVLVRLYMYLDRPAGPKHSQEWILTILFYLEGIDLAQ